MQASQASQEFWYDWVGGPTQLGAAVALTTEKTSLKSGKKIIPAGLRMRRIYWAPVLRTEIHLDFVSAEFVFYRDGIGEVGRVKGVWAGNDPQSLLDLAVPSFPFHRLDSTNVVFPKGIFAPMASDPNSRVHQYNDVVAPGASATFVLNPTEIEIDANQVELESIISIPAANLPTTAYRQYMLAGVLSGRIVA